MPSPTSVLSALVFLALSFSCFAAEVPAQYDLVVRNGRIIDGTGKAAYEADLGVRDGKIAAIGKRLAGVGKVEIDAAGKVVAPGFIDVHTHVDEDIHRSPKAENFVRDGVTTIVCGNCGGSVRDVGAFFRRIEAKGAAVNVATLVGHNTVLRAVKGDKAGDLTAGQLEEGRRIVRRAMLDGAVGMSTGLIYNPGQFSPTSEIVELQKVAAGFGGLYVTHMRSESGRILEAIDEALRIGREAGCRVQISHFKLSAEAARTVGGSDVTLGKVLEARKAGMEIWLDQYPYTASSTTISTLIPDEYLADGVESARKRLRDPAEFEKAVAAMNEQYAVKLKRKHLGYVVIASSAAFPQYNGKNLLQIAQLMKLKEQGAVPELLGDPGKSNLPEVSMADQCRAAAEIFRKGNAQCVFHTMAEPEVENIMRSPLVAVASDSGLRDFGVGVPHPRGYGTNARVLGLYSREKKLFSLEEAVRKMTSLPALSFRFMDRGTLKPGFAADVTVFDPAAVLDKATYDAPHQYPEGITHVLVNGVVVFQDGKMTDALPGRPVYGPGHERR